MNTTGIGRLLRRLRALLQKSALEREMAEEIRLHVELETDELVRGGIRPDEARRLALVAFGGVERFKEEGREARGIPWLEDLAQDLRYAARGLARSPGFAFAVIATLTLAIGANVAMFAVADAVLLSPLSYRDANRLVRLTELDPSEGGREQQVAPPTVEDWRRAQRSFEGLAAIAEGESVVLLGAGGPEKIEGAAVSADFFQVMGAWPGLGRGFLAEDDRGGARRVVVLSDALWRRRFGADPGVVGRLVRLGADAYEVVGVARRDFEFPRGAQLWLPLTPALGEGASVRGAHILEVVGRLAPGVDPARAEAELGAIQRRIAAEDPSYAGYGARVESLRSHEVGSVRAALLVLLAAVGFVLLIACANVANLLLARAGSRAREMSIRLAVGAGRRRLVRQLLTESVVLAAAGGACGLLLAVWGVSALRTLGPDVLPRAGELRVSGAALAFTVLVTLLTGIAFGLVPALRASRLDLAAALRDGAASLAGGLRSTRLRGALVVAESTLTLVLLIGAGLMLNSLVHLLLVDPGFRPEGVSTFRLALPAERYSGGPRQEAFFSQLRERARALPGVRSVGLGSNLPVSGQSMMSPVIVEGHAREPGGSQVFVQQTVADEGYFRTLGIRLAAGRVFTEGDGAQAAPVAIVNQELARRVFPGEDPIGKGLRTMFGPPVMREIVGVVADIRHAGPARAAAPHVFVPFAQSPGPFMTLVVRADGEPGVVAAGVRAAVLGIDPEQAVDQVASLRALLSGTMARPRLYAFLLGGYALLALLLAAVGLYGVIAYSVAQRTHEIGVRVALGATTGGVMRAVLGQGLALTGAGMVLGLLGALAVARVLRGLLFGVGPADLATYAAAAVLMLAVSVAACYVPARRAARVDPMLALRNE